MASTVVASPKDTCVGSEGGDIVASLSESGSAAASRAAANKAGPAEGGDSGGGAPATAPAGASPASAPAGVSSAVGAAESTALRFLRSALGTRAPFADFAVFGIGARRSCSYSSEFMIACRAAMQRLIMISKSRRALPASAITADMIDVMKTRLSEPAFKHSAHMFRDIRRMTYSMPTPPRLSSPPSMARSIGGWVAEGRPQITGLRDCGGVTTLRQGRAFKAKSRPAAF